MEKMERKIQEVAFDVEIQYCNPDDMVITSLWQKYQENLMSVPVGFPVGTLLHLYIFFLV